MDTDSVKKIFVGVKEVSSFQNDILTVFSSYEKAFYFEQPDKGISFCGIDTLIDLSSDNNHTFTSLHEKVKSFSLEFENGNDKALEFPVVLGGMKFPGNSCNISDEWCDFNDSDWFIPQYLLLNKNGKNYFIFFSFEQGYLEKRYAEFTKMWEENKSLSFPGIPEAYPIQNISKYKWHLLVDNAISEIKKESFSKVVLSRKTEFEVKGEMNFDFAMDALRVPYKSCTLFIYKKKGSYFFGATPEKAASFCNGMAEFDALAGSAPRGFDKFTDSRYEKYLLNSIKDRDEHNYVIEYIKKESSELVKEFTITETVVKKLNNIQHLFTGISAEIKEPSLMFPLLDKVIPTPAVCGLPKDAALKFIIANEGYSRGLYSGTIGWFNLNYEGEFMAALRSALFKDGKLSIFAGGGIVENSDPTKEYEETELKMLPIMSIFL